MHPLTVNYQINHINKFNNKHRAGNNLNSLEIKYNLEDIHQQLYTKILSIFMVDILLS